MHPLTFTRRSFMTTSGRAIVGSLAFSSGAIAMLAPTRTWALPLEALSTHDSEALLRFCRHLYPHDTLENAVYALVVKDLDSASQADAATAKLLHDGVSDLDKAAGGAWLELSAERQLTLVRAAESRPSSPRSAAPQSSPSIATRWRSPTSAMRDRRSPRAVTSRAASTTSIGCPRPPTRRARRSNRI